MPPRFHGAGDEAIRRQFDQYEAWRAKRREIAARADFATPTAREDLLGGVQETFVDERIIETPEGERSLKALDAWQERPTPNVDRLVPLRRVTKDERTGEIPIETREQMQRSMPLMPVQIPDGPVESAVLTVDTGWGRGGAMEVCENAHLVGLQAVLDQTKRRPAQAVPQTASVDGGYLERLRPVARREPQREYGIPPLICQGARPYNGRGEWPGS